MPDGTSQRLFSSMLLGDEVSGGGPQISGTMYDWIFAGSTSCLLHGNAWGLVTNRSLIPGPNGNGLPTGISWLPPERISVQDDEQQPENPLKAKVYYNGRLVDQGELVHLKAFSIPGRLEAISPLRAFSMLWAQGLETLKYSADWFGNGGFPPGTFQNINEEVDEGQAKEIRRRLTDTIRQRQPLVYGRDWEYKPLTVPPNEATFIQAMQLNATQVAAIFGIKAQRVGGTRNDGLSYSNQTEDTLDEITSTLRPWLTRWEHLLTSLLPSTQYARFDVDALLKLDPKTKWAIGEQQRTMGVRSINELRAENDWAPIGKQGDDHIPLSVLMRMVTTTRAIPKSIVPEVMLEVDHIAQLLEEMQLKGLTAGPAFDAQHGVQPTGAPGDTAAGQDGTPAVGQQPAQAPAAPQQQPAQAPAAQKPANGSPYTISPGAQTQHETPAVGVTPEQYLGRLLTSERAKLFGPPDARVADSDRKSAVTMLKQHARMGHLDQAEAAARITRAGQVQTTGQLAELFTDLPRMPDGVAPSVSRETFGAPEIRASDADRRRARELITAHGKAGRLRGHEIDERNRKAAEAITCGDLATLFKDLPAMERAAFPPEEDRAGDGPLFGPAAMVLLRKRAAQFDMAGQQAATNGKAH